MNSAFRTVSVISLLIALMAMTASAQGSKLTLDDCIELAIQKRASIIAARGAESLARAGQRSALGAFLPRIYASYNYGRGKETDIEPPTVVVDEFGDTLAIIDEQDFGTSTSLTVSAAISVIDFSNFFDLFGATAAKKAAHLDVINSEQDLIYSVKLAYYGYLAAVENVRVQEKAVARSEESLKLTQSRYDLGSASLSEVLKQKVQYGRDQLSFLRARNAVVTTWASLAYTIGIDANSDVEFLAEYEVREFDGTLDDAIAFGIEHEPGLLAAEAEVSAAKHGVRSGFASYLPTLNARYSFTRSDGTRAYPLVFDYSSNQRTWGFSVDWNIFDGFSREYRVTSAKVSLNNSRARMADTRNNVIQEIKTAFHEIEQQREAQKVATESVDAAQEDFNITQEKYNLGAATILDLLDAQASLTDAQVEKIRADFDLNLAVSQLENAMGKM
ncbi:MAG: TolC family protein [Candidatus Zixiibacteriota bacterium]|nr:MAG: TolC family protein [candidate division Zixibacteria bacterium]